MKSISILLELPQCSTRIVNWVEILQFLIKTFYNEKGAEKNIKYGLLPSANKANPAWLSDFPEERIKKSRLPADSNGRQMQRCNKYERFYPRKLTDCLLKGDAGIVQNFQLYLSTLPIIFVQIII